MKLLPDARIVALRIAVMFSKAGKTRARISEKTVKELAERTNLTNYFRIELQSQLEELGVCINSNIRGGFNLLRISSLDGAGVITPEQHLQGVDWEACTVQELCSMLEE